MPIVRIIPFTIFMACLFIVVKVGELSTGMKALSQAMAMSEEDATTDSASHDAEAPKEDAKPAEEAAPAKEGEAPKEGDAAAPKEGEAKPEEKPMTEVAPGQEQYFSAVELELLQKLSLRRAELQRWEDNIQIKEAALVATEQRVNEKIAQIEAMREEVSALLEEFNQKEDAKIRSLVKIYESMKPKDAARIFDELEMPVLLMVIDKMSEKKAAVILAEMEPKKAKQLTVELAQQRQLNSNRLNQVARGNPISEE